MSFFHKKDGLAYLGFLGLVLLFFYNFLDGSYLLGFKDLSRYFYPLRYLMVEQMKSGIIPLWNPYIFCGYPLLATFQIGFFYPLSLIYYLMPFNPAFNYYILLHYWLAAVFMYWLLRYYKLGRWSAFFGGVVFAFSGYLLSVSNMNTSLSSVIWLPLMLLFFDRLIKQFSVRGLAILSVLAAIMLLGGEPTIIYITFIFLAAYAAVFSGSLKELGYKLLWLLLAGAGAIGLTAVQLLPFFELSRLSDRVARNSFELVSMRSFPFREVMTFILPYFYGNSAQYGSYTETLLGKNFQDWLISPYIGILPLILLFFAFRRKKEAWFFAIAGLTALLFAFGSYTPLYRLAYSLVPGMALIRYPVKFLFLVNFCLCLLAAFGFEQLSRSFGARKKKYEKPVSRLFVIFLFMILLFLFIFAATPDIYKVLAKKYPVNMPQFNFAVLAEIVQFNLQSIFNLAANIGIILLLFWLAITDRIRQPLFLAGLVLVTIADLFSNGASTAVAVSAKVFDRVPVNYQLLAKDKEIFRFFYTPEQEAANRLVFGRNYTDALYNSKNGFCANWHIPYHFSDFYGYESIQPYALQELYRKGMRQNDLKAKLSYLSQLNVKYLMAAQPLPSSSLVLLKHQNEYWRDLFIYQNKAVFPRAYLLEGKGGAAIDRYQANEVLINVNAAGSDSLFLADAYYPGWKAFVDGKEVRIERAKDLFRSVKVPAGEHKVKFVYDPWTFKIGAGISLLTVLVFGGLWVRGGNERRGKGGKVIGERSKE